MLPRGTGDGLKLGRPAAEFLDDGSELDDFRPGAEEDEDFFGHRILSRRAVTQ
jgi:hypothetical protein